MLIAEHPDATLNQLKEWGGFACTLTTLWRTLRRFRLTYKKKTLHACERDTPEVQAKRRRYRAKVRRIEAKRLVFVDETGVNTAMTPTHAWARRGERAEGSVPSAWGSTTVIAALGLDGVRAPLIFPGATDTQAFQTYVDQVLVPELRPGDVVVFDNLKPHLSRHVAESIERAGATVLPLPPYSSDYDPIEELWPKFKGQLRRIAARTKDGLYKAVGETLDGVTIQDILGACPNICSCSRMAAGFRWALAFSASAQPCARTIPLNLPRRCRSGARSSKDCGSSRSVATRPTLSPGLATETCGSLART